MNREFATYLQLMERRLRLIRALTAELRGGIAAITATDVRAMEKRTLEQESICSELASVLGEIKSIKVQVGGASSSCGEHEQLASIERATAAAAQELMYVGHVHSAFIRRSRRSINVLMNVLSTPTADWSSAVHPIASYF